MSVELRVPSMGESVRSGIVARWLKAEGDAVAVDEPVVAIDSDKATVEIPSPVAGRLQEQAAKPGDEVAIGQVVARIAEGAAQEVATPVTTSPATVKAGPAARAALREAGVEAGSVTPTGRGGRVTRADVEAAADRPRTETPRRSSRCRPSGDASRSGWSRRSRPPRCSPRSTRWISAP
jgi:2-oxoglutarate dehydrogenase E2 component (dihydrolipoamide succinyltransferase)